MLVFTEYQKALDSRDLDSSDFILISTAMLESKLGPEAVAEVKDLYVNYNYEDAIGLIKTLAQDPALEAVQEKIFEASERVTDTPEGNQSRRYFETKFTQGMWSQQQKANFDSLAKLAQLINKVNPVYALTPSVKDLSEALNVIATVRDFGERTQSVSEAEGRLRSSPTAMSTQKDRGAKKADDQYSMNPGISKASDPMPVSERLDTAQKNKLADTFYIDRNKQGYSQSRAEVPFVNSVSGTAYTMVAVLSQFIDEHKDDVTLEQDVNNITKSFIAFTCMKGFHSMAEMIDVLNSEEVQGLFRENNLQLDTNFSVLGAEESFKLASDYSKTVNLKRALNAELSERHEEVQGGLKQTASTQRGTVTFMGHGAKEPSKSEKKGGYPGALTQYVRENKATGPRVASAIENILREEGHVKALNTITDFMQYAKGRSFNLKDIKALEQRISTEMNQGLDKAKPSRPKRT